MGTMEVRIDFLFLTMDQIKEMAIRDRLKKMDGDKMRAAESLQIHFHTIDNILKTAEQPKEEVVVRQEEIAERARRGGEGWTRDLKTGQNVPSPISPMPGIDKIVGPLVEAERGRIKTALEEGPDRVTHVIGGTPVNANPKTTKQTKGKTGGKSKSKKSSKAKAGHAA